jgi:hypothetical protein
LGDSVENIDDVKFVKFRAVSGFLPYHSTSQWSRSGTGSILTIFL